MRSTTAPPGRPGHLGQGARAPPAGAGSLAPAGDLDGDATSLQVTVPRPETSPGLGQHRQPQVRSLGPRIRTTTGLHQHRPSLTTAGQQAPLVGRADPVFGTDNNDIERIEQGGHHRAPGRRLGRTDQHHPFEADTELRAGQQTERGNAHHSDP